MIHLLQLVPKLLKLDNPYETLKEDKIQGYLDESASKFRICVNANIFKEHVDRAEELLGVNFQGLLTDIFVECKEPSWDDIHRRLFLMSKFTRQQYHSSTGVGPAREANSFEVQKMEEFRMSLGNMWRKEGGSKGQEGSGWSKKEFYTSRDLVRVGEDGELLPDSGMVYFLIKTNVAFHKVLRYASPIHFLAASQFGPEVMDMAREMIIAEYNDVAQKLLQDEEAQARKESVLEPESVEMQALLRDALSSE